MLVSPPGEGLRLPEDHRFDANAVLEDGRGRNLQRRASEAAGQRRAVAGKRRAEPCVRCLEGQINSVHHVLQAVRKHELTKRWLLRIITERVSHAVGADFSLWRFFLFPRRFPAGFLLLDIVAFSS